MVRKWDAKKVEAAWETFDGRKDRGWLWSALERLYFTGEL